LGGFFVDQVSGTNFVAANLFTKISDLLADNTTEQFNSALKLRLTVFTKDGKDSAFQDFSVKIGGTMKKGTGNVNSSQITIDPVVPAKATLFLDGNEFNVSFYTPIPPGPPEQTRVAGIAGFIS